MKIKNLKLKIIFFGTPNFVDPIIKNLDAKFDLVAIIRKPIKFDNDAIKDLQNLNADFFIVASYGKIIPEKVLEIPKITSINIHPSLLPKYRGPAPIQTAIINGDKKTGVSFIKMDSEIDHGPIISQFEEDIKSDDSFQTLAERLFSKSADALKQVITSYNKAKYAEVQIDEDATFTKLFKKEDGFINASTPPENLERLIRGLFPWPGVWTQTSLINNKSLIIKFLPNQKIQVEGKKPMNYKDFINGYPKGKDFLQKLSLI